jgi:hypothetical protein
LAGVTIGNDIDRVHSTIRLEDLAEVMIRGVKGEIADKNIHASILKCESVETIAKSSEQHAEATNVEALCGEIRRERTSKLKASARSFIG